MSESEQGRRSFLVAMGGLGMSHVLLPKLLEAQAAGTQGFVHSPDGGEHLIHFRDHGNIFIKLGAATDSQNLAMGTQQVMKGSGIPVHRHLKMDEAFYILEGSGTCILNDARHTFEKGSTIFIPKLSWHGFENPDQELLLLWLMTPAGLDGFFRETCSPPGVAPKQLSREQIREIARKYDTESGRPSWIVWVGGPHRVRRDVFCTPNE